MVARSPSLIAAMGRIFAREEESQNSTESSPLHSSITESVNDPPPSNQQQQGQQQQPQSLEGASNNNSNNNSNSSSAKNHSPNAPNKPPLHPRVSFFNPTNHTNSKPKSGLLEAGQYRRRRTMAPPSSDSSGAPPRRRAPFDESSEETSMNSDGLVYSQQQDEEGEEPVWRHRIIVQDGTPHAAPQEREAHEEYDAYHNSQYDSNSSSMGQDAALWDSSDRTQFPILEIQRMKNKANKLRTSSSSSSAAAAVRDFDATFDPYSGTQVITPSPPSRPPRATSSGHVEYPYPHGNPIHSPPAAIRERDDGSGSGSCTTAKSSVTGQSVRTRDSQSNFVKTGPAGQIWTSAKPRASSSWDNETSSLGDILDHYTSQESHDPRNHAEQSLRQSFVRAGRKNNRTPSPSTSGESRNPSVSDSPGNPTYHPKAPMRSIHQKSRRPQHEQEEDDTSSSPPPKNKKPFYPVRAIDHSTQTRRGIIEEDVLQEQEEEITFGGDGSTDAASATVDDTTVSHEEEEQGDTAPREQDEGEEGDFTLHDLCGEASSTNDIAWRNALYVLSERPHLASIRDASPAQPVQQEQQQECDDEESILPEAINTGEAYGGGHGWAPLHIACLGPQPPPSYITRALLSANPRAVHWRDDGGRLPLHLAAASSADQRTMELLLQTWPDALWKRDAMGLTPLHLLLRNESVPLTVQNCATLLGLNRGFDQRQQMKEQQERFILQRRGQHLKMTLTEMEEYRVNQHRNPVTILNKDYDETDEEWRSFPPDVQVALRKLSKWRRQKNFSEAQHRKKNGKGSSIHDDDDEEADDADDSDYCETNPAVIPHYSDLKLPIHMAVQRGIIQPVPLRNEDPFSDEYVDEESEYDSDSDQEVSTQGPSKTTPANATSSVVDVYNVLRCIISAFPEGLCVRDAEGKTPLLHIMTMTHGLPNPDMIELLLGKRSGAFEEIPPWLSDLPLHSISTLPASHSRFLSPAMVSSARTNQLPLHIAAEEFHTDTSIVESIYKSYPAAVDVQDFRGRTPLHLVFSNYRVFPADPRVISVLLSDSSAKTRDCEGNLPFDMLIEAAPYLPKSIPNTREANEMAAIYQKFFSASLLGSFYAGQQTNSEVFLRQLRQLPPWVRRQACSVSFVQKLIVEELSSPLRTACVVLDGLLLVAALVLFRLQVKSYVEEGELQHQQKQLDQDTAADSWYLFAVQTVVSFRILILIVRSVLAANVGQLFYLVFSNGWFWIDLAAMCLTFATTLLLSNEDMRETPVLTSATAATGLLWLSLLGFGATWFFGMSLLLGSLSKIANQLLWPIIGLGMMLVAFAQMFYTLLGTECDDAIPVTPVCSVRDSYRVVYLLLSGNPLVDVDTFEEISNKAIFLIAGFFVLLLLLVMAALVAVIMGALNTNTDEVAFRSFWEPKLAFVLSSADWGFKRKPKLSLKPSRRQGLDTRLEQIWDVLVSSLFFGVNGSERNEKNWYASRRARGFMALPLWLVAVVVVPLWFVLGFLTLGLLWPPQLRRMLFHPLGWEEKVQTSSSSAEHVASQLSDVRSELVKLKTMTYERSVQVEREVHSVKQLIHTAMVDE